MGGGHFNGKNHGGEHTGDGKKQKKGPYSSNGFSPDTSISHLDFTPDNMVIYVGTNKNKNKIYIPNGCEGIIMDKGKENKLQKTSRSMFKVNFGDKGIHYVRKELLQHVDAFTENQILTLERLDTSSQHERNEKKKLVQEKLQPAKHSKILSNRAENKQFRKWRKEHLDEEHAKLQTKLSTYKNTEEYYQSKKREAELKQLIRTLKMSGDLSDEQTKELTDYQGELKDINKYFDKEKKDHEFLQHHLTCNHDRRYVLEVISSVEYQDYLYHHYNQRDKEEKTPFKSKSLEPSRKYIVDNSGTTFTSPPNIDSILWGL